MGSAMRYQPQGRATPARASPLSAGLVSLILPTSNPAFDLIANAPMNGVGTPARIVGPGGIGLGANGSSSYAWRPAPELSNAGRYTLVAVVQANGNGTDTRVLGLGASGSTAPMITIGASTTNPQKVRLFSRNDSSSQPADGDSVSTPFDGKLHTIVMTYDLSGATGRITLFVDGVLDSIVTGSESVNATSVNQISVGAMLRTTASSFWKGAIYLAGVYNRTLSDADARALSANAWQLFDAGSSSSAYLAAVATSAAGTGSTPTTISATKAASTINGGAAQVTLPSTVAANQASESTAGLAAGITLPTTISASTATVADTGLAASISLPTSISASAATATDSGLTASVSTGSSISASQASETASGLAAGVVLPTVVSASQATASDSGLTASITTGAGIQASTATETETGLSASVSLPTVIGAAKATGTDAGLAATVTSGAGIQASTASEASAGQQAQITLPTVVAATEGSVTINCQPATVSIGESIKGSTGTGSDIGYPAQVSSTTGISASVATETSAVLAADINTYVPPLPINPLRLYVGEARARKLYGGKDDVQNLTEMIVGDVETFSYSFKKTLPSGATITGAVPHIVVHAGIDPNPQAMVVGLPTINGAIVSIELKALVPGVSYWPRMTATYSDRQQVTLPDPGKGSLSVVA